LRYEFFIAKRFVSGSGNKDKVSGPIVKIAVASVMLSVVVMLLSVAAGKGMQAKIREKVAVFSGHALILPYNNNHSQLTLEPVKLRQNFYPGYHNLPDVAHISPFATIGGILKKGNDFEGIIFKGVDSTYDWHLFRPYLKQGKIPVFHKHKTNDSILISKYLAERLRLKTGDKVRAYFLRRGSDKPLVRRFFIGGIYETDFEDYDKNYIIGDLNQVRRLYHWSDSLTGGFEVLYRHFDRMEQNTAALNEQLDPMLIALSLRDLNPYLFDWLDMFDFNIYIIIFILLIVSALSMSTVMLVMITERIRHIGILRTLGATDLSVMGIFLLKALWFVATGLILGNLLALGIIFLQNRYGIISLNPEVYYVKKAPLLISLKQLLILDIGVMVLIGLLMILPAKIVSAIKPGEVLKWD